jgi:hypothetical protein
MDPVGSERGRSIGSRAASSLIEASRDPSEDLAVHVLSGAQPWSQIRLRAFGAAPPVTLLPLEGPSPAELRASR